ncbi:MAG: hypothetical protein NTW20_17490 [Rhodobacterales bacterium]|nr:hypothetical protein [Rhodobacterales bacterium]
MQATRYLMLSLLLGGLTVWGSENLFWTMPFPDLTPLALLLTVLAYSVASAVALSAVIWTGVGGLPAAFLGGAIVGYMSEGVIVGTIYQPFPPLFFLVWTQLAWHALITGGLIFGVGRAAAVLGPIRLALIWTFFGLSGAYWAQYWVTERPDLPDPARFAGYILVLGLIVPLAHAVMDRIGQLPRPKPWVLSVAPVIATGVWLASSIADPNPMRLVLPPILMLILWVMWRLGQRERPVSLGTAVPVWHHLLFLIAPALVVWLAPLGWAQGWGSLGANWVVAGITILGSVAWMARLVRSAAKRP